MIIRTIKEFNIQHDAPLQLLRVEWAGGLDMSRLRQAFGELQAVMQLLKIKRVLLELDNLPDISAYDQIWLGTHWMPSLLQLPLQQAVVVLSSQQVYNQHAVETMLALDKADETVDVQFFTQTLSALHWLTDESPRLPALLAEWRAAYGNLLPPPSSVAEPRAMYRRL